MTPFSAHRPRTLEEAVNILSEDDDAKLLAGGHSLVPVMKQGLALPSALVDISGIDELKGISERDGALRIGAMTRHEDVHLSSLVRSMIPAVADLAGQIGDAQVRRRGTLGGSLATNDPGADYPSAVLALDGRIETSQRVISAADYFCGVYTTALEMDEIVVAAEFTRPDWACYRKMRHPASGLAMVGVFVARLGDQVRVAVTGAGDSGVFRAFEFEEALGADFRPGALDAITVPEDEMANDFHATPAYRANLVKVLTRRCVEQFAPTAL